MAEAAMPIDPHRELPGPGPVAVLPDNSSNPRLNGTAEAIGTAVGSAVEKVKRLPERLQEMKERFTVIRGRAQEDAVAKAQELKVTARVRAEQARSRATLYAHEYPLHVIAGVAAAGFVLGVALRIWRSSRA